MMNARRRQPSIALRIKMLILLSPIVLWMITSLWFSSALGQSIDSRWVIYKQEDGLASNNVWKILPHGGEVWFGTDNGVSRFNGEWRSWTVDAGFPAGNVKALTAGPESIWAGTDRGDLLSSDGEEWDIVRSLSSAIQVIQWIDGELWIGTNSGLYTWNGNEAISVPIIGDLSVQSMAALNNTVWVGTEQGIWLRQRDTWSLVTADNGLPDSSVTALWVDTKGVVWVGTEAGVAHQEPGTGVWHEIDSDNIPEGQPFHVQALAGDSFGTVWGGVDDNGYFTIDEAGNVRIFPGDFGLTTRYVHTVAVDADDAIWFGTISGVFRYEENTWGKEVLDPVYFPGVNYINTILVDQENQVWIGTQGAGVRLKPDGARLSLAEQTFNGLRPLVQDEEVVEPAEVDSPLPDDHVHALAADDQGNVWAGTEKGVTFYSIADQTWSQPISVDALPAAAVQELLFDRGVLWIGTPEGLARYTVVGNELTVVQALEGKDVRALTLDSLQRVWVGTRGDGIFAQMGNEVWAHYWHQEDDANSISNNDVVALSADLGGGIWAAVDRHGLNYWDGERWHDYGNRIELPSKLLYTLYVAPVDGSLWIGSEGGVTRYDGRTWETLSIENILPNASIFAITHTLDGRYLFGGRDGLSYYRPESTPPWIRIDPVPGTYTHRIGSDIETTFGEPLGVRYFAGDLHTAASDLDVIYRVVGPNLNGTWVTTDGEFLDLSAFEEIGDYTVELVARDRAFNYSEPARLNVAVVMPPSTVQLPFVGQIESEVLVAFVLIAGVAAISFVYMSVGIVQSRRRVREALVRGFNPFVSGEPVRREDMFFGRMGLLQRIIDTLHNNSIMIHGERRIGKTTLLYQLAARLREADDPEYWFIPLPVDLEGTTEENFFHFLFEEILSGALTLPGAKERLTAELQDLLYRKIPAAKYSDREFSRDLRDLIRVLQSYGDEIYPRKLMRLILLLDEMDVMSGYSRLVQQRLRRIFMRDFAATLGAVVAGIQINKDWDRVESPWYNLFNEIELGPFTREQAEQLLVEPIRAVYQYQPAALKFIIDHSDGRPHRLQQHALYAVNRMLSQGRREIRLEDVEHAYEQIQRVNTDTHIGIAQAHRLPEQKSVEQEPVKQGEPVDQAESAAGEIDEQDSHVSK